MTAYFSSKLPKQIHAALMSALLVFCLLGTHWVGFSHSISHASLQSKTEIDSSQVDKQSSLKHSSDVCHLFDALTLAGFVAAEPLATITFHLHAFLFTAADITFLAQTAIEHYQSRAPPTLPV